MWPLLYILGEIADYFTDEYYNIKRDKDFDGTLSSFVRRILNGKNYVFNKDKNKDDKLTPEEIKKRLEIEKIPFQDRLTKAAQEWRELKAKEKEKKSQSGDVDSE